MTTINNIPYINRYIHFDSPHDFYVASIIQRTKDGHKRTRILKDHYLTQSNITELLQNLKESIDDDPNLGRLYVNPNRRRFDKMPIRMINKMVQIHENQQFESVVGAIHSVIGNCSDEKVKKWVVDIDSTDKKIVSDIYNIIDQKHKQFDNGYLILQVNETPNGFHIITNPFDVKHFNKVVYNQYTHEMISIHKNSPTLLYYKHID